VTADLAMAKVKEDQISLKELEENLTKKQSILEKQKLDYDENITKKEHLSNKVSYYVLLSIMCNYYSLL